MIETKPGTCQTCGRALPHASSPRARRYCSDACKQADYRKRTWQHAHEEQMHIIRERWGGLLLPATQAVIEQVLQASESLELAERVAAQFLVEIKSTQARIAELEAQLDVEKRFRTDTQVRRFKTWLKTHPQPIDSDFWRRILADSCLPHSASRSLYVARLRQYSYSAEDVELFNEAWKAMLVTQS